MNASKKKFACLEGMHAREWITAAALTYAMNQMMNGYKKQHKDMVDSYEWYFLPVANPDGYAYTHAKVS